MPESSTNETIIQPNPYAGGRPAPPISLPGQGSQTASGGSSSNNSQGPGQNTIIIDDEVSLSGPSTSLNGTPQQSGPSSGGNVQPTTPGTDFNNTVTGMAPGANGTGQNQSSGSANGWRKDGNNWYYFDPATGNMVKGWKKIDGLWYYLDPGTGIMATGWVKTDGLWYYLEPNNGHMLTGWQYINQEWYYLETTAGNGQMVTGWKLHNGKWYYLFESGAMAHGGWIRVDEKWYCVRSNSGELEISKIIEYNGKKYYVNNKGVMLTSNDTEVIENGGTIEYNGVIYAVDWEGVCTAISVERPVNGDQAAWKAYIESTPDISETRRKILLTGFKRLERGCVYHQLRSGYKTPGNCGSGCKGKKHPDHGQRTYSYDEMAAYTLDDPYYLDCSYFVKHCYFKAGIEVASGDTAGFNTSKQWSDISREALRPADVAVERHISGYDEHDNPQYAGHIIMFLGFTQGSNETVWIEMANHATGGRVSAYDPKAKRAEYKYRKWIQSSLD